MERSLLSVNNASDERIEVGKIVAPHGVRGDLRIRPDIERPEVLKKIRRIFLGGKEYKLLSARPHKNIYILRVEGVEDRNMAETLIGKTAEVPLSVLPRLPEGEYYYFQLLGLMVCEENGHEVGPLKEIIETGANDVYVVGLPGGKELCLPAIPSCIRSVDLAAQRMTVCLPEWEDDHED